MGGGGGENNLGEMYDHYGEMLVEHRNLHCHAEEKVTIEDVCKDYKENACSIGNKEVYKDETFKTCSSIVKIIVERKYSNVKELVCGPSERTDSFALQEDCFVQMCPTVKDRVCDVTSDVALDAKDTFLCISLDANCCETKESTPIILIYLMRRRPPEVAKYVAAGNDDNNVLKKRPPRSHVDR